MEAFYSRYKTALIIMILLKPTSTNFLRKNIKKISRKNERMNRVFNTINIRMWVINLDGKINKI